MAGGFLGPLGAKAPSLLMASGSFSDRWAEAGRDYDLMVLGGNGHADCAMGWLSYMVLVPAVGLVVWLIGLFGEIPVRVSAFAVSLPGIIAFVGFGWSGLRHLTRRVVAGWSSAERPSLVDDAIVLALGTAVAYVIQAAN